MNLHLYSRKFLAGLSADIVLAKFATRCRNEFIKRGTVPRKTKSQTHRWVLSTVSKVRVGNVLGRRTRAQQTKLEQRNEDTRFASNRNNEVFKRNPLDLGLCDQEPATNTCATNEHDTTSSSKETSFASITTRFSKGNHLTLVYVIRNQQATRTDPQMDQPSKNAIARKGHNREMKESRATGGTRGITKPNSDSEQAAMRCYGSWDQSVKPLQGMLMQAGKFQTTTSV